MICQQCAEQGAGDCHISARRDTVAAAAVIIQGSGISTPKRTGDAGLDLAICQDYAIWRAGIHWLKTDVRACLPEGHFGMIVGRSSLARKHGVLAVTGIIDAGYTGLLEIGVMHAGHGSVSFLKGERLAQMIILPVTRMALALGQMPETERGAAGWGSTG